MPHPWRQLFQARLDGTAAAASGMKERVAKIYDRFAYKIYRCFMLANTKTGCINEAVRN